MRYNISANIVSIGSMRICRSLRKGKSNSAPSARQRQPESGPRGVDASGQIKCQIGKKRSNGERRRERDQGTKVGPWL